MREIAMHEAKAKLSEILVKIENGEHYLITKHGKPVAQLTPISETIESLEHLCKDMLKKRDNKARTSLAEATLWKHEGHER